MPRPFRPSAPLLAIPLGVAACLLGAPAARAAPTDAPYPKGSYMLSCFKVHWDGGEYGKLAASCVRKDDHVQPTTLFSDGCKPGSVSNDDGALKCEWDGSLIVVTRAQRVRPALAAAGVMVLGHEPSADELVKWYKLGLTYGYASPLATGALEFSDAAKLLRRYLVEQASSQERYDVIAAAYKQVNGSAGIMLNTEKYAAGLKAGSAWYATIVVDMRREKAAGGTPASAPTTPAPPVS